MDTDFPELLEQQAVIDIVEASLDVALNGPHGLVRRFASSIYDIDDTPDCMFLCPIGAKAVALRIKSRFTDRLDNDTHALLYDPVQYSGDTQRSFSFRYSFRYIHGGLAWVGSCENTIESIK